MHSVSSNREKRWTPAEDEVLFAAVTELNKAGQSPCWKSVAALFPNRTNKSCRKRWVHSVNPTVRKGRWSPAEDAALIAAVNTHGMHWYQVARTVHNGRTDDQCAKRWREALDPTIRKDAWVPAEDKILIAAYVKYGRKWNKVAAEIEGRPPVQCRNRFMSLNRQGLYDHLPEVKAESVRGTSLPDTGGDYKFGPIGSSCNSVEYGLESIAASRRTSASSISTSFSFESASSSESSSPMSPDARFFAPSLLPYTLSHCSQTHQHTQAPHTWNNQYEVAFEENYTLGLRDEQEAPVPLRGHNISYYTPEAELFYATQQESQEQTPLSILRDASAAATYISPVSPSSPSSDAESRYACGGAEYGQGDLRDHAYVPSGSEVYSRPSSTSAVSPVSEVYNEQGMITGQCCAPCCHPHPQPAVEENMQCPIHSCDFCTQSLIEMWRHITWGHVSSCHHGREVTNVIERLVLKELF